MTIRKEEKMSKIYQKYLELKEKDTTKLYLFRCGNFYIFLDEDAKEINNYAVLKLTKFTQNIMKCGFPVNSLENYMKVFKNQNLDIEVIEHYENSLEEFQMKKIQNILENTQINEITPLEALNILAKIKEIVCEK